MISKKTWILIIAGAVALVGVIVALVLLLGDREEEKASSAVKVSQITSDTVCAMKLTEGDNTVDLVRTDGTWRYREGGEAQLDQSNLESALTMVCYLYAQEKLFDSVEDLSVYGLEAPALYVEIELEDGEKLSFSFGGYTADRQGVFMKYSGSDAIYLYDLDSFSILQNAAKAMRDLSIDIDAQKLVRIEILRQTGEAVPVVMELIPEEERVGRETWRLTSPFTAIANAEAVNLVTAFFASPRYSAYAGDGMLKEYGFENAQGYISLEEEDGTTVTIRTGGRTASGRYYCTQDGREGVYELASGFEALLALNDENLFPGTLFPIAEDSAADVLIKAGRKEYRLEKINDTVYNLNNRELTSKTISILFKYISELSFGGVAQNADVSGEPEIKVTLAREGKTLEFGFYKYRNEFYSVELDDSGTASGYVKAEHIAVFLAAFAEAAGD